MITSTNCQSAAINNRSQQALQKNGKQGGQKCRVIKGKIMNGRPNKAYQSAAYFQVDDQPWLSKES
jgi:hypothetical protein